MKEEIISVRQRLVSRPLIASDLLYGPFWAASALNGANHDSHPQRRKPYPELDTPAPLAASLRKTCVWHAPRALIYLRL